MACPVAHFPRSLRYVRCQRGLLERGDELERLAAAIADPGRVVVVEGEAGIGKSALLEAGGGLARDVGARVLRCAGDCWNAILAMA